MLRKAMVVLELFLVAVGCAHPGVQARTSAAREVGLGKLAISRVTTGQFWSEAGCRVVSASKRLFRHLYFCNFL